MDVTGTLIEIAAGQHCSLSELLGMFEQTGPKMRVFHLHRVVDETGVSGTGIVAVGIQFPSGQCVMEWVSKQSPAKSLGVYVNVADLIKIHGHDGKTKVKFV